MSFNLIDTEETIRALIESIDHDSPDKQLIFVDLEGVDLGRDGSIAIMQVMIPPINKVHLVDVHILQHKAFDTPASSGHDLKAILENEKYAKVFFDVRSDSDAMFSHFNINLRGVIDLQLLEYVGRERRGGYLKGLAKCISESATISREEKQHLQQAKDAGQRLFKPELGGSYKVFLERPLADPILQYCVGDVLVMPKLLCSYGEDLPSGLASRVHAESLRRVALSQRADFCGKGRHMAVGPSHIWAKSDPLGAVPFPMTLVCSDDLKALCALGEPQTPVADQPTEEDVDRLSSVMGDLDLDSFLTPEMLACMQSIFGQEQAYQARRRRRNERRPRH